MKVENVITLIILVCGLIHTVLGLAFFFGISTLMGFGWFGGPVTGLSFIALQLLNVRNRNKGAVLDERLRHAMLPFVVLAYGITNIGITFIIITSVFGGSVNSATLVADVAAMLMIGWGIPLVLFALSEFGAGRDA